MAKCDPVMFVYQWGVLPVLAIIELYGLLIRFGQAVPVAANLHTDMEGNDLGERCDTDPCNRGPANTAFRIRNEKGFLAVWADNICRGMPFRQTYGGPPTENTKIWAQPHLSQFTITVDDI